MGRWTRVAGAVAGLALAAVLSGCGGDDSSGGAGPTGDSTVLPTASGTPASAVESAQHFIRRWEAAEVRMQRTGKTAAYLALSKDCAECRHLARTVHGYYAAGGYIRTAGWRIDSIDVPPSSQGVATYLVHVHVAPMTIKQSSSHAVEHIPGRQASYLVSVFKSSGSYTVTARTLA